MMRRAALALVGLASIGAAPAPRDDVRAWVTTGDGSLRLAQVALSQGAPGEATITVDPDKRYQTMVGFGASITDASAILIRQLPPAKRNALMRDLFGRGPDVVVPGTTMPVQRVEEPGDLAALLRFLEEATR